MAKVSPLVMIPPAIFAGLAAVFWWGMRQDDQGMLPTALAGKQAPAVQVQPLGDLPVLTNEVLRDGKPKLVNFFASWCAPCRVEHPSLKALADEGVPIYGINYKDNPEKALAFLAELGNPYAAVGADPKAKMGLEWGVYGVPETFVLDGQGRIITRFAGPLTERPIKATIRPALEKAAAAQ